jgi:hypothetical protein
MVPRSKRAIGLLQSIAELKTDEFSVVREQEG